MIGNDIVDLVLAQKESNWKRKGFLEKIFTPKEQLLIQAAENQETMIWNLWSRKEAAYKIYNRQTGIRAFIPRQLECLYENEIAGLVSCYGYEYYTKTEISDDRIYTIAVTKKSSFDQIITINPNTRISKKNGIPFLVDDPMSIISKSHHGRFFACIGLKK